LAVTHLWAPWRSAYVHAKQPAHACIFCDAAERNTDEETLVVHRAGHCFVMLNRYPYTSGHVMIAPYEHVSRLSQTSEAAAGEMMRLTRRADAVLERVYRPDGLNLGMNLGEAAGAGIEQHIHMHVLPRWAADANFMTTVGETRVLPEALEESYARLKQAFSE
jgi:ATP adenylyltransferase